MVPKIILALFLLGLLSCNTELSENENNDKVDLSNTQSIKFQHPTYMQNFKMGDSISVEYSTVSEKVADSSVIYLNNVSQGKVIGTGIVHLNSNHTGMQTITVKVYYKDTVVSGSTVVSCYSDIKPVQYAYKVLNKYKHSPDDYTQGLQYDNGFIYEGTGQKGESVLKKYKLSDSELIQSYQLPSEDFGEGIVLFKNYIYQLTWQSGIAYKYEKETFKLLNRFVVQTEGWGITTYENNLIMSDGSNVLYELSPESFDVVRRIEVYDNIGPVGQLNELENVGGKIFANVYTTNFIVIIDPKTGRVEGKINLEGLLKQADNPKDAEVLNGIAWKGEDKKLLVTGKWWPNIFYIEYY
ncbi:MAG: glutamine cyclotransferase [Bacteroidetes bacterium HGW-Bacteroidetes-21]|nr:MAG: glutamine cyclotransferase [Bacteroidetes bacterium HGW-Bacteroidetes-21]